MLRKGATSSDLTGPDGDHTTGEDYYIYIEASDPQVQNDRAILLSAWLPPMSSGSCFR